MHSDTLLRSRALIRHNLLLLLRDPGPLISYLVMPMVLMLVLKPLYVRALDQGTLQVVIGPLVMFSVLSLHFVGNLIVMEREWGTWDRLRSGPSSSMELLLGKAVPALSLLFTQQAVLFLYGCFVIDLPVPRTLGLVALAIVLWSAALLAIGFALATVVRSHAELGAVADIGALTLTALGGALLPVSLMPGWAQWLAHISPGYWAISLLRDVVQGNLADALVPALVLLGVTVVAGGFALTKVARGWGRSQVI